MRDWLLKNAFDKSGNKLSTHWAKKAPDRLRSLMVHTEFFNDDVPLADRVFAFLNGQTELNRCIVCGSELSPKIKNPQIYCGRKCARNSGITQDRIKNSCLDRYGVENPSQSPAVQSKMKSTMLDRYGVEYPSQSDEICQKRKESIRAKYGVDNAFQADEVKESIKRTMLDRYGVEHSSQLPSVRSKRKSTMLKRYGVDNNLRKHIEPDRLALLDDPGWLRYQYVVNGRPSRDIADDCPVYAVTKSSCPRMMTGTEMINCIRKQS